MEKDNNAQYFFDQGLECNKRNLRDLAIDNFLLAVDKGLDKQKEREALLQIGQIFSAKGYQSIARKYFDRILKINSRDHEAIGQRGWSYFQDFVDEKAEQDFNQALELNDHYAQAYYDRGFYYKTMGNYDQAMSDLTRAVQLDPDKPAYIFERGLAHLNLQNLELAKQDLNHAIEKGFEIAAFEYSKNFELNSALQYYYLAQYHFNKGNDGLATENYKKAIDLGLDEKLEENAYLNMGRSFSFLKQYDIARDCFNYLLKQNPDNSKAQSYMGVSYYQQQEDEQAEKEFLKALAINPQEQVALDFLGDLYMIQKKYDQSFDHYSKSLKINPYNSRTYFNRGVVALNRGDRIQSVQDLARADLLLYEGARKWKQENIGYESGSDYFDLSMQAFDRNDFQAARENTEKAIELFKKEYQVADDYYYRYWGTSLSNLGFIELKEKNYSKAIELFEESIKLRPAFADPWLHLGNVYLEQEKYDQAVQTYNNFIELAPRNPDGYYNRGIVFKRMSKFQEALDDFNRAIQIGYPDNNRLIDVFYNRAYTYKEMGKKDQAVADFKQLINLGYDPVTAYDEIDQLEYQD